MARPERTIVALDLTDLRRFARTLTVEGDRLLFCESARSWWRILGLIRRGTGTLIVMGARPPDKAAVRYLGGYAETVVILQHASNRRRKFKELPRGYIRRNLKKLIYWSLFSILCRLLSRGAGAVPIRLYHFTSCYRDEWTQCLGEERFSAVHCPRPDPTRFGTIEDIPVTDVPVAYQLIDEPFTQTLGISNMEERELLQAILNATVDGANIMVKVHPRSHPEKYAFSRRYVISDSIHSHAETVIGYRSGLLDYRFVSRRRLTISPNGRSFDVLPSSAEKSDGQHLTYLDCVERDLAAQGR